MEHFPSDLKLPTTGLGGFAGFHTSILMAGEDCTAAPGNMGTSWGKVVAVC